MAKFNLKIAKKKAEMSHSERLDEQREHYKNSLPEVTGNMQKLLDDVRDDTDHKHSIEKQLDGGRDSKGWNNTLEAAIDEHEVPADLPKRDGKDKFDQLPINLLEEVNHQSKLKDHAKDDVAKEPGTLKQPTSQLHNHPDRFTRLTEKDVRNNKKVKEMVTASLQDADAMLYYIYRVAAEQKRSLTAEENALIEGISVDKTHLTEMLFEDGNV